jgi:hypothetical protein
VTKCLPVSAVSPRAPNFVKVCAYVGYPLDAVALVNELVDYVASDLAQCQSDVDTYNALLQVEKDRIKAVADVNSRYLCPLNPRAYVAPTKSDCSRRSLDNSLKILQQNVRDGGSSCSQDSDCADSATNPCYSLCTECFDIDTCNKNVVSGLYTAKSETNCLRCVTRDGSTGNDGMDCLGFPFAPSTTPSSPPGSVNTATVPTTKKSSSASSSLVIIVVVVAGAVILLFVIAAVVIYKIKKRKNAVGAAPPTMMHPPTPHLDPYGHFYGPHGWSHGPLGPQGPPGPHAGYAAIGPQGPQGPQGDIYPPDAPPAASIMALPPPLPPKLK